MAHTLHLKSVICQRPKEFEITPKRCEPLSMRIGDVIKEAREASGFTQEEAAKLINISQKSWSKIEKGIIKNPRNLHLIESILGLPEGYLTSYKRGRLAALPQPIIARCPLLNWEEAAQWPEHKDEILKSSQVKPFASKIILGPNAFTLKIQNNLMSKDNPPAISFVEGSYLIVDPDEKYESGDYVIAKYKNTNSLFFRRYVKEAEEEYLIAGSSEIKAISVDENIEIKGVIILSTIILKND